jgi:hypothetical protein
MAAAPDTHSQAPAAIQYAGVGLAGWVVSTRAKLTHMIVVDVLTTMTRSGKDTLPRIAELNLETKITVKNPAPSAIQI